MKGQCNFEKLQSKLKKDNFTLPLTPASLIPPNPAQPLDLLTEKL